MFSIDYFRWCWVPLYLPVPRINNSSTYLSFRFIYFDLFDSLQLLLVLCCSKDEPHFISPCLINMKFQMCSLLLQKIICKLNFLYLWKKNTIYVSTKVTGHKTATEKSVLNDELTMKIKEIKKIICWISWEISHFS